MELDSENTTTTTTLVATTRVARVEVLLRSSIAFVQAPNKSVTGIFENYLVTYSSSSSHYMTHLDGIYEHNVQNSY